MKCAARYGDVAGLPASPSGGLHKKYQHRSVGVLAFGLYFIYHNMAQTASNFAIPTCYSAVHISWGAWDTQKQSPGPVFVTRSSASKSHL